MNIFRTVLFLLGLYSVFHIVTVILGQSSFVLFLVYLVIMVVVIYVSRARMYTLIGNILFRTKSENAEKYFQKAYAADKKNEIAVANYAILLTRSGKGEEAVSILTEALERKPQLLNEKSMMLSLGSAYWIQGDNENAIKTFELMLEKYDYVNASVLSTLGFIYLQEGNEEKALEITEKALEQEPMHASAWDNMGQIRYRSGKTAEAKEAFLKAVEYNQGVADSLYFLGEISEKEGDQDDALAYYRRAKNAGVTSLNTITREMIGDSVARLEALKYGTEADSVPDYEADSESGKDAMMTELEEKEE